MTSNGTPQNGYQDNGIRMKPMAGHVDTSLGVALLHNKSFKFRDTARMSISSINIPALTQYPHAITRANL